MATELDTQTQHNTGIINNIGLQTIVGQFFTKNAQTYTQFSEELWPALENELELGTANEMSEHSFPSHASS